jgi:hypothetical protein
MAKSTPSTRGNKKKVTMKTPSKPKESKPAKSPVRSQTAEHGVEFSAKPEIVIDEETGVMSVHGIRVDNVIQLKNDEFVEDSGIHAAALYTQNDIRDKTSRNLIDTLAVITTLPTVNGCTLICTSSFVSPFGDGVFLCYSGKNRFLAPMLRKLKKLFQAKYSHRARVRKIGGAKVQVPGHVDGLDALIAKMDREHGGKKQASKDTKLVFLLFPNGTKVATDDLLGKNLKGGELMPFLGDTDVVEGSAIGRLTSTELMAAMLLKVKDSEKPYKPPIEEDDEEDIDHFNFGWMKKANDAIGATVDDSSDSDECESEIEGDDDSSFDDQMSFEYCEFASC